MLAVAGPLARSKQKFSDFPQTGAGVTCVNGLQSEQPARQLQMLSSGKCRVAKQPDCGNLGVETIVIGQIEMKRYGTCHRGSMNHVEPNDFAAAVDQEMFGVRPTHDPRIS